MTTLAVLAAVCPKGYSRYMRGFAGCSPLVVYLVACIGWFLSPPPIAALEAAPEHAPTQTPATQSIPADPRVLYQALNALRPDPARVYAVKSLSLRRDVINLTFDEGKLAFFRPLGGRITGAAFAGRGHAIATPHDPGERRSLAQFVGVPILDQTFSRAYLRFDDGTAEEIEKDLEDAGDTATSDSAFTQGWESLFTTVNPWHSLRIMEDWLAAEPIPYFQGTILSDTLGTIDMLVDARRKEQVLFGQPHVTSNSESYDVWASFPSMDSLNSVSPPREAFLPIDYNIDTRIADDLSLDGTTTLHLKARRGGERIVPLELSRNLSITGIKGDDGSPLIYFQNQDLSQREISRHGNDTFLVVLPAALPAGAEFHLEVSYHGNVITDAGNGVQYVGEHQTWYAHVGGLDHFALFNLSFRWPKRLTLVATGTEPDVREDGDFKIGRWHSELPFAVAGFNLGDYETEVVATGRPKIELYANRQLENAILAELQQHSSSFLIPQIAPRAGFTGPADPPPPPSPASVLGNLGDEVLDSIHFYERMNGPFPFPDLEVSQIPGNVGQGWPGLVYLATLAFLPPEAQERAGIAERTQSLARDVMPFHEVAHQWWGNVTLSATYRDVWIEEGMANYQALLYADERKPASHHMAAWLDRYRTDLTTRSALTGEAIDESGPLTLGYRLKSSKNPDAYETVIYGKGTWVMHMLREMMRDGSAKDPDARFRELLHFILTDYRFETISTAEFQRAVEKYMTPAMDLEGGHSMNWFFGEWVHATGIPHYHVQFDVKPHGNEFVVSGKLEQTGVDDVFTAAVPLYATRTGEKPQKLGVVVTTGPDTRFHFTSQFRPTHVTIDPHRTLLCVAN